MSAETIEIPRLMTVKEVAEALRCSKSKVYALIYAKTLPTATIAGKTLCRASDVNDYITECLEASGLVECDAASMKPSDMTSTESGSGALSAHRRTKRLTH